MVSARHRSCIALLACCLATSPVYGQLNAPSHESSTRYQFAVQPAVRFALTVSLDAGGQPRFTFNGLPVADRAPSQRMSCPQDTYDSCVAWQSAILLGAMVGVIAIVGAI